MPNPILQAAALNATATAGLDVTGLDGNQLTILRQLTSKALDRGWTDETLARRLKPVIGLSPRYAQAVENLRDGLTKGVKVGDKTRTLNYRQIEHRVDAYSKRLALSRSRTVAQYEVAKAIADAKTQDWIHKQTTGELSPYAVKVFKLHRDERNCKVCKSLNGRRSSLADKPLAPVHPHCRCHEDLLDEGIVKGSTMLTNEQVIAIVKDRARSVKGHHGGAKAGHKFLGNQWVKEGFHEATEADKKRLRERHKIVIPPAWTQVQVHNDINNKLQVLGRDAKGRQQYKYAPWFRAQQDDAKHARVANLHDNLAKLDKALAKDGPTNPHAGAVTLMRHLGMRTGSEFDTKADAKGYGATNLRVKHAKTNGKNKTVFNFVPSKKHGESIEIVSDNPLVAKVVAAHSRGKSGEDRLFGDSHGQSDRKHAEAYLHSVIPGYKLKDLRTAMANSIAQHHVDTMPAPTNKTQYLRARKQVGAHVSALLGNTPTVALNSYVDPAVFKKWEDGIAVQGEQQASRGRKRAVRKEGRSLSQSTQGTGRVRVAGGGVPSGRSRVLYGQYGYGRRDGDRGQLVKINPDGGELHVTQPLKIKRRRARALRIAKARVEQREANQAIEAVIYKKFISASERRKAASAGDALPDGSYPIRNRKELKSAITLAQSGHGNVAAAKRLIRRKAKQFGVANPFEKAAPNNWSKWDAAHHGGVEGHLKFHVNNYKKMHGKAPSPDAVKALRSRFVREKRNADEQEGIDYRAAHSPRDERLAAAARAKAARARLKKGDAQDAKDRAYHDDLETVVRNHRKVHGKYPTVREAAILREKLDAKHRKQSVKKARITTRVQTVSGDARSDPPLGEREHVVHCSKCGTLKKRHTVFQAAMKAADAHVNRHYSGKIKKSERTLFGHDRLAHALHGLTPGTRTGARSHPGGLTHLWNRETGKTACGRQRGRMSVTLVPDNVNEETYKHRVALCSKCLTAAKRKGIKKAKKRPTGMAALGSSYISPADGLVYQKLDKPPKGANYQYSHEMVDHYEHRGQRIAVPEKGDWVDYHVRNRSPHKGAGTLKQGVQKYDVSPLGTGKNWVTRQGGLPLFVRAIAHALIRHGHTKSSAIAIALGASKRWARGGGHVRPKTRAKSGATVAEWEAKRAKERLFHNKGVKKAEFETQAEIVKVDKEHQTVFGWAYVTHDEAGTLNVDKSGEFVDDPEELEKSAYSFVLNSRKGGQQHERLNGEAVQRSTLIESMVFTPEKMDAMGIEKGTLPVGWWTGWKVHDPNTWKDVKDGKATSFSIHGAGTKKEVPA